MNAVTDLRLVIPAAGVWAGCLVAVAAPHHALPGALVAGSLSVICVVAALLLSRRGRAGRILSVTALTSGLLSAALAVVAIREGTRDADVMRDAAAQHRQISCAFRIESAPRPATLSVGTEAAWSVRGTTVSFRHAHNGADVPGGIPVTLLVSAENASPHELTLGAVIHVRASIRAMEPGSTTNYRAFATQSPRPLSPTPWWLAWTVPLREKLSQAARTTPGDGGVLLPGLAIGDESAVPSQLDAAMKVSSLSHLTAVSGSNISLVTALVVMLGSWMGLGRRSRIVCALASLVLFVCLVGPSSSVIRAAVMAAVVLSALLRSRMAAGLPALSFATIVLLLNDPWISHDYGFALSVLATTGLLLLARPLSEFFARWLPDRLALVIAVPLSAQLMCQPVLLMLAPTLPLYGVLANIVAAPAAPVATILGAVACVLLPWSGLPVLELCGHGLVWLAWLPSTWITMIATAVARFPGAALPWPPSWIGITLSVLLLGAISLFVSRRPRSRAIVRGLVAMVACIGAVSGGAHLGRVMAWHSGPGRSWSIAACDIGQGDAFLLRSQGFVAMIDVGPDRDRVAECVDKLAISTIDLLVLTHFDHDHVGGLRGVVDRVSKAFVGRTARSSDEVVVRQLTQAGVSVEQGHAGIEGELGRLRWKMLWPPVPSAGKERRTGNAGSLVLEARGEGMSSLFLGDLGESSQKELMRSAHVKPVDVVKVAHHGSSDQSPVLYETIHAQVGLISAGAGNSYGHPTKKTLDLLSRVGTFAARTDQGGLLTVAPASTPNGRVNLWAENPSTMTKGVSRSLYSGCREGELWPPVQSQHRLSARVHPSRTVLPNCHGILCAPPRSSWSAVPKLSLLTALCDVSVRSSMRTTLLLKLAISPRQTTPPVNFLLARAPPFLLSRD